MNQLPTIFNYYAKIQEMCDLDKVQDDIASEAPCIVFLQVQYPAGNVGYFLASHDGETYTSTSIGEVQLTKCMEIMAHRQPHLDTGRPV